MALRNGAKERYSNIAVAIPFCLGSWIVLIVLSFLEVVILDDGGRGRRPSSLESSCGIDCAE
jgi:hypothetical protein